MLKVLTFSKHHLIVAAVGQPVTMLTSLLLVPVSIPVISLLLLQTQITCVYTHQNKAIRDCIVRGKQY